MINTNTTKQPQSDSAAPQADTPEITQEAGVSSLRGVSRVMADPRTRTPSNLLALQRTIGNKAVQRLLAKRPTMPAVIQREIDPNAIETVTNGLQAAKDNQEGLQSDFDKLDELLAAYSNAQTVSDEIVLVEKLLELARQCAEDCQKLRGSKQIDVKDQNWSLYSWEQACNGLAKAAAKEKKALEPKLEELQKQGTEQALSQGTAKYLQINPNEHNALGDSAGYGSDVPPEKRFTLKVNGPEQQDEGLKIDIQVPATTLDLLVIAGGHGGINGLFWGNADKEWWKEKVIDVIKGNGIKARVIVLDQCLSANMVDLFEPLLAGGGKIISYLHSISLMTMNPQVWKDIYEQLGQKTAEEILTPYIKQRIQLGANNFPHSSIAIFDKDVKTLSYDPKALSQDALDAVDNDQDFKKEMDKTNLGLKDLNKNQGYKLRQMENYKPALVANQEGGVEVQDNAQAAQTVPWSDQLFFDSNWSPVTKFEDVNVNETYILFSGAGNAKVTAKDDVKMTVTYEMVN